jgi:hypothetical protein
MAKKSRRVRRQGSSSAQPIRIQRSKAVRVSEAAEKVDFSQEYHYVVQDLKRIAIIAAGLLALLIVLALLIG